MARNDKSSQLKALHDSLLAEVARGSKDPTLPARIRAAIELNKKSMQEGKVSLAQINKACERILEAKYKLGLFEEKDKEN